MLGIPIGITNSTTGLKISATAATITKYEPIIKEKKNKKEKIVLLPKSKLNNMEILISKVLIDSNISHDEFFSINNVLKEYDYMKEEIENSKT